MCAITIYGQFYYSSSIDSLILFEFLNLSNQIAIPKLNMIEK